MLITTAQMENKNGKSNDPILLTMYRNLLLVAGSESAYLGESLGPL